MDEIDNKRKEDELTRVRQRTPMGLIPLQAGCLTFALASVAILVGLWLDLRLGTAPRWTLILLIGSAPVALGGVYFIARRSLRRLKTDMKGNEPDEKA
jgi:hypothetical protein